MPAANLAIVVAYAGAATAFIWLPGVRGQKSDVIDQDVRYLWPITVWTLPLAAVGPQVLAERLAEIGERGFDAYVRQVLPRELRADKAFARSFEQADDTRFNAGFLKWQKRVFSNVEQLPIEDLDWDGSMVPRVNGVTYAWPELYKSDVYMDLRNRIHALARMYFKSIGSEFGEKDYKEKLRIFIWAEVHRFAGFYHSRMHTGAALAGKFFARHTSVEDRGQRLLFQDARGVNPPYGRSHKLLPVEGDLVLWPSWAPHWLTPQTIANSTNVHFSFLVWPPDGPSDFDWEDDPTGDYSYKAPTKVRVAAHGAEGKLSSQGGRSEL